MNFKLVRIVILIGIILLIGVMGYYGGWWDEILIHKGKNTLVTRPAVSPVPALVINQPKLTGWDGQKKTWEITAAKMSQTDDGNFIYFEKIENGIIFAKDKRVDFTAGWARWERFREMLYIGEGLEARTGEGGYFGTAEAVMNFRTQDLFCPKEVIFSESNKIIKANTMRMNFKREEISLQGDVELTQDQNVVKAGGIVYNSKDKQYRVLEPKGITIYP